MSKKSLRNKLDSLFRNDYGYLLAALVKRIKDIELAEDVLQDAIVKAHLIWPEQGTPQYPKSWLYKTAYNKAIDLLRREQNFKHKSELINQHLISEMGSEKADNVVINDDRLQLIFTCCHPALRDSSQIALILNTVCGLTTEQVAEAFLTKPPTMAQRLVRAKRKIKSSGIPFNIPAAEDLPKRLSQVLTVIYLIYNQGYYNHQTADLMDLNFTEEAFYLAKTLNQLMPKQAELLGLLALMSFHQSRFKARSQCDKTFVTLKNQDRSLWDKGLIKSANDYFQQAIGLKALGPLQIQAAISGVHSQAANWDDTDWSQITLLYEKLLVYQPTDTVKINLAVAKCYSGNPELAWQLLLDIKKKNLEHYLPYYLAQAEVAKHRSDDNTAFNCFSLAMALSKNVREQRYIKEQIDLLM